MNFTLSRSTVTGLVLLVFLPTAATWQLFRAVTQQRADVRRMRDELEIVSAEKEVVQSHIEEIQIQLAAQKPPTDPTSTVESRAAHARLPQAAPVDPWVAPPEVHPDWNRASPYIWIPRESLTQLPLQPFGQLGALDREVAEVLGVDPDLSKQLHAACSDILRRRETLEMELAVASFPESSTNRMQLEVQFPSEAAAKLQSSFAATLRKHLGAQRADLILTLGRSWIDEQFSPSKSVTVTLLPGDKFEISSSGGGIFRSVGGISTLEGYMPPHFAARFLAHFESLKLQRAKESKTQTVQDKPRE